MKNFLSLIVLVFMGQQVFAQQSNMEEFMYSSGKIHVVIAVVLLILVLLFLYLFRLDKKVSRMEKEEK